MNNSIIENYVLLFQQQKVPHSLIDKVSKSQSLEHLNSIITAIESSTFLTPKPLPVIWYQFAQDIRKRMSVSIEETIRALPNASADEPTCSMVQLLIEVLHHKNFLLHHEAMSLLHYQKQLSELLLHLAALEKIEKPEHPRRGSFDEMPIISMHQKRVLDLLRANAHAFSAPEKQKHAILANNLLQCLLTVHGDLHGLIIYERQTLVEEKTHPNSCCVQ